jgi:hypothetical protein
VEEEIMITKVERKRTARNAESKRKKWLRNRGMYAQMKLTRGRRSHMRAGAQPLPMQEKPEPAMHQPMPKPPKRLAGFFQRILRRGPR